MHWGNCCQQCFAAFAKVCVVFCKWKVELECTGPITMSHWWPTNKQCFANIIFYTVAITINANLNGMKIIFCSISNFHFILFYAVKWHLRLGLWFFSWNHCVCLYKCKHWIRRVIIELDDLNRSHSKVSVRTCKSQCGCASISMASAVSLPCVAARTKTQIHSPPVQQTGRSHGRCWY